MLKTVHVHYRIHDFPTHEHMTTHTHTLTRTHPSAQLLKQETLTVYTPQMKPKSNFT